MAEVAASWSPGLPRWAGVLIFAGAVMYGVGPLVSIALAHAGIVVLAAGCLMLAGALLRPASVPTRAAPPGLPGSSA